MKRLGGTIAALVLAVACGSSDDEELPKTAAEAFTKDYCDAVGGPCCAKNSAKYYDRPYCRQILDAAHAKGGLVFDQDLGDRCLAGLKAAAASATFCDDYGGEPTSTQCARVFRAAGEPAVAAPVAPVVPLTANEGETCGGYLDKMTSVLLPSETPPPPPIPLCPFGEGLFCSRDTKTCAKRAPLGSDCRGDDSCADGAFCAHSVSTPSAPSTSSCTAWSVSGDACSTSSTEHRCGPGLFCATPQNQCAPLVPKGGACTTSQQCGGPGTFCQNGVCGTEGAALAFCPTKGD